MIPKTQQSLKERVIAAAEAALADHHYVSPIDVLLGIRWLAPNHIDEWRKGRLPYLEMLIQAPVPKRSQAIEILREWAEQRGLRPESQIYPARSVRASHELQFTSEGDPEIERLYRVNYLDPTVPEKKREKIREKLSEPPELVVFSILRDSECSQCKTNLSQGSLLLMERNQPLCLSCADLDHLAYLERGDAALTRRARKHSTLSAVVVKFSRSRRRHERQGILIEESALERAEQECVADEEERARRRLRDALAREEEDKELAALMTAAIRELFPGCPAKEAAQIARHASVRGSGRVGRSASGRALDEEAVRLAVIAHIRHAHTNYDELLMSGLDRPSARDAVQDKMEEVLEEWQTPRG